MGRRIFADSRNQLCRKSLHAAADLPGDSRGADGGALRGPLVFSPFGIMLCILQTAQANNATNDKKWYERLERLFVVEIGVWFRCMTSRRGSIGDHRKILCFPDIYGHYHRMMVFPVFK